MLSLTTLDGKPAEPFVLNGAAVTATITPPLPPGHVEVKFAADINGDTQGRLMLAWERLARETLGVPVELYKATAADDLKRRRDMTPQDRQRL